MISLQGEFYACSASTRVMVYDWTTRDKSWWFCHPVFCFQKNLVVFYKKQGWQNELINVPLDEQEWYKNQLPHVLASLSNLRMPDMPTNQCVVRATGVSGSCWPSGGNLHQATLTQPARSNNNNISLIIDYSIPEGLTSSRFCVGCTTGWNDSVRISDLLHLTICH